MLAENFRNIGGLIEEMEDGFKINGGQKLAGGMVESRGDHRNGYDICGSGAVC